MSHPFSPWRSDAPNAPPQVCLCSALQLFWFIFALSLPFPHFSMSAFFLFLYGFVFFDLDSSLNKGVVQSRHWCCCVVGVEMKWRGNCFPIGLNGRHDGSNYISSIWSSLSSCVMFNLSHFFSRERFYICAQMIQMRIWQILTESSRPTGRTLLVQSPLCSVEDMMTLSPDDRQWTYWAQ